MSGWQRLKKYNHVRCQPWAVGNMLCTQASSLPCRLPSACRRLRRTFPYGAGFHSSDASEFDLFDRLKAFRDYIFRGASITQGQLDQKIGVFAESLVDPALMTAIRSLEQLVKKVGIDGTLPSKEATGTFLINLLLLKQHQELLKRERDAGQGLQDRRAAAARAEEKLQRLSKEDREAIKEGAYFARFAEAAYGALGNIGLLREKMRQEGFSTPPIGTSIQELERMYIVEHLKLRARTASCSTLDGSTTRKMRSSGSSSDAEEDHDKKGRSHVRTSFLRNMRRRREPMALDVPQHGSAPNNMTSFYSEQPDVEVTSLHATSKAMEARVFFVAVDKQSKNVVVSVRGTFAMADIIMGIMCEVVEWKQEWGVQKGPAVVHQGVADGAQAVWSKGAEAVATALRDNPGYGLVLTGHSLGAATAIVLRMMLEAEEERSKGGLTQDTRIRCFAFGPPPLFGPNTARVTPEVAESITCFVNRNDVVPHLSLASVFRLVWSLQRIDALPLALPQRAKYLLECWLGRADEGQGQDMQWILKAIEQDNSKKPSASSPSWSSSSSSLLSSITSSISSSIPRPQDLSFKEAQKEFHRILDKLSPELDKVFEYLKKSSGRDGGGDGKGGLTLPSYDEVLMLAFQLLYGSGQRLPSKEVQSMVRDALLGGGVVIDADHDMVQINRLARPNLKTEAGGDVDARDEKANKEDGRVVQRKGNGDEGRAPRYSGSAPPDELYIPGKIIHIWHDGEQAQPASHSSSSSSSVKSSSPLMFPRPAWVYADGERAKGVVKIDLADDGVGDHFMSEYMSVMHWLKCNVEAEENK